MIHTYRVPFSHDSHAAGSAFQEFASAAKGQLGAGQSDLRVVSAPIFSYGQRAADSWNVLSALFADGHNAIVYLSDIEYYATVLVSAPASLTIPGHTAFAKYQSFDELLRNPRMVGYGLPGDFPDQFVVPESYVVVGQLMYSAYDDKTDEPNPDWYDIIQKARPKHVIGPIHAYRIRNSSKCLELIVCSDEPSYFLPESDRTTIEDCLLRYNHFENNLTDYLFANEVPFATINDGHWDDNFAVSYGRDIWQFGDSSRMFVA